MVKKKNSITTSPNTKRIVAEKVAAGSGDTPENKVPVRPEPASDTPVRSRRFFHSISDWCVNLIKKPYYFFNRLFVISGIIFWILLILLFFFLIGFFQSVPDFKNMSYADLKSAGTDYVRAQLEDKTIQHSWVALRDVNRELLYTVVMAENGEYFEHKGINYDMMINALGENIKRKKLVFGASTIS